MRSQSALGAKFRRLRSRLGVPKAITAMAHLVAKLVYRMPKFGQTYVDKGMEYYETKRRQQQLLWVAKQAAALNMQLIPITGVSIKFLERGRGTHECSRVDQGEPESF